MRWRVLAYVSLGANVVLAAAWVLVAGYWSASPRGTAGTFAGADLGGRRHGQLAAAIAAGNPPRWGGPGPPASGNQAGAPGSERAFTGTTGCLPGRPTQRGQRAGSG